MSPWREIGKRLVAVALGLLAALLAAELLLRLVYDPLEELPAAAPNWEATANLFEEQAELGYRMAPYRDLDFVRQSDGARISVHTNNLGLRDDRDYTTDKTPGALRILLLGDSLVFGAGVSFEETIGEQLETILQAIYPARPVEVMNWGVAGYGQEQERRLLEILDAPAYQPDLILVVITTSNDFGQSLKLSTLTDVAGLVEPRATEGTTRQADPARPSLGEHLKRPLRALRTYRLAAVYYNRLLGALGRRAVQLSPQAAQASRDDLERLLAYGERQGLKIGFVLLPPRGLAFPLGETYAYDRRVYSFYEDNLKALGADYLSLEDSLIGADVRQDPALIYWDDVHLTAGGNRLAAQAIADFVIGLVGSP